MSLAAQAQYARAQALLAANDVQGALESFQRAFELDPQQALDRRPCLDVFRFLRFEALPDFWHGDLLRFLRRDDVDRFRYTRAALNVLLARPEFREACAGGAAGGNAAALDKVMRDPLFQLVLADGLVADPGFELLLISLRRRAALDPAFRQEAPIDFLASLALQCVTNEHIYAE